MAAPGPRGTSRRRGSSLRNGLCAVACTALALLLPAAGSSAAKDVLVFGQEKDVPGFNTSLACCNQPWAEALETPVIRGAFITNNRLQSVKDLVASAHATKTTLTYTIRKNANWNWDGRILPVTYADFAYTWQQMVDAGNPIADRTGYDQITGYTHRGDKQITFTWKSPVGAWQHLFDVVYPSAALAGQSFGQIWSSCICGNDGKPIADGPFMLTSYVHGQGATLVANPSWYGRRPHLREIDFRLVNDTNAEVQALKTGQVDAISPTFGINLLQLKNVPGIEYSQVPGLSQEHIDIQFGKQGQPLLRAPWVRRALMMGIDRQAILRTIYGDLAGSQRPLDSLLRYQADALYKPDFHRWDYNPKKAFALLKAHCVGGPRVPSPGTSSIWTCGGIRASFRFTWPAADNARTTLEAIVKAQLRSLGVEITDAPVAENVVFTPAGIPSGNYDLAEFAWSTGPDPSAFVPAWDCGGASNYLGFCDRRLADLFAEADAEVDPAKRNALFARADAVLALDVPSIPMFSRPSPLAWRKGIVGLKNNPSPSGFAWNAETWRWR
jgi:glutathione transport system substrate-binding protein